MAVFVLTSRKPAGSLRRRKRKKRRKKKRFLRKAPFAKLSPDRIHVCAGNAGSGEVSSALRTSAEDRPINAMEINNLLPITTRKELRIWLGNNHLTSSCCWVLTTRKPSPHALLYLDAVEEALCFG
jgi:hypothetical protein